MSSPSLPAQVLLVEDSYTDVLLLREAFREHQFECRLKVLEDGEQALVHLASFDSPDAPSQPDLIVLDLNLPRHDGIEVLAACRKLPGLAGIPVVILTSSDSPIERKRAEALGATAYLRKPIQLEEFLTLGRALKQIVQGRARQAAESG